MCPLQLRSYFPWRTGCAKSPLGTRDPVDVVHCILVIRRRSWSWEKSTAYCCITGLSFINLFFFFLQWLRFISLKNHNQCRPLDLMEKFNCFLFSSFSLYCNCSQEYSKLNSPVRASPPQDCKVHHRVESEDPKKMCWRCSRTSKSKKMTPTATQAILEIVMVISNKWIGWSFV